MIFLAESVGFDQFACFCFQSICAKSSIYVSSSALELNAVAKGVTLLVLETKALVTLMMIAE